MKIGQLTLFQNNVVAAWQWKWSLTWRWLLDRRPRDPATRLGFYKIETYGKKGWIRGLNSRLLGDWALHLQPNMRRKR